VTGDSKRTPLRRGLRRRIDDKAIKAWREANYFELHKRLKLHPGCPSPLPSTVTPLGVDPDYPPERDHTVWARGWPEAVALQKEFMAIAGWPDCRDAYEANLAEAEEWAEYLRNELEAAAPGARAEKAAELEDALDAVRWRKELLADLDEVRLP
jgi:hypothetical protein